MHPIKNVFRCIVRHSAAIGDGALRQDLRAVKRQIRRAPGSAVMLRQRTADLFLLEKSLRDVVMGRSSLARVRALFGGQATDSQGMQERNQNGSYGLYMQHEMRRFDGYNRAPEPGSRLADRVHRQAAFANQFWRFAHKYDTAPGVHPNAAHVADPGLRRWSVVMGTILAPYEAQTARGSGRAPDRPRTVRVKTVERNSAALPVLHISGSQRPARGFRRHLAAVNEDFYTRLRRLEAQIWLATQYSKDPLDGEDMREWVAVLRAEHARVRARGQQLEQRLEVQRRILLRRRDEIQRNLDWQQRRRLQNQHRQLQLHPPKQLTLNDL